MSALHESLRKQLEKTVIQARDVAEEGARAALARLGVGLARAFDGLTEAERDLRTQLRARGRLLGDGRKASGEQETRRLAGELAYEYWHRMLFARFLAENDLLMHPQAGVSVSLADCEELAREEGLANGWLLAERWAARMLPEIFRPADPLLQVPFAPEHERGLEKLLEALPAETFRASDALGWVYQFWQARRKDEVNKSGVKIGAEELPAVTQLFTEPYMVHFLLDNTLGAWWTARHPGEAPKVAFEYLRLLEDGTPAAGTFDGWPKRVAELKVLDPCCGSGHFLVAAFLKLVPLRVREEGLNAREACDAVLRDNLHGLEIDPRCTQIAAFAVALAAWTYPRSGGYRPLPGLKVACSGLALGATVQEWADLAESDVALRGSLERLHVLFSQAPVLGSLINPREEEQGSLLAASFAQSRNTLRRALGKGRTQDEQDAEAATVAAEGLAHAADLLSGTYSLIATNVPYLGRGKQHPALQEYSERRFPVGQHDLATSFLLRSLELSQPAGTIALVTPQNWLFLGRYTPLRECLLQEHSLNAVVSLGAGAFGSITGAVVNTVLFICSHIDPADGNTFMGLDVTAGAVPAVKGNLLKSTGLKMLPQLAQLSNPDARITLEELTRGALLERYARGNAGMRSGDIPRFGRCFWEMPRLLPGWIYQHSTVSETKHYGGMEHAVLWENGMGQLFEYVMQQKADGYTSGVWKAGYQVWGQKGVLVSQMSDLPATLYTGEAFDNNVCAIVPANPAHLPAVWAFCSSAEFRTAVRRIDQKLNVTNATMVKVPFDLEHWMKVADALYPAGLPDPTSNDPTQWVFVGLVRDSMAPLHVAIGRLLGYSWPDQARDVPNQHSDRDGIVCLPAVSGERAAADRLQDLLAIAYDADWSAAEQAALLASAGSPGATLESWLRDDFFAQHCALFHQRPFIWHVWDGRKDGFAALVNYHQLNRHTLQTLAFTYLGDWIARQEADAKAGKAGADLRLAAARVLQRKLELILEGEPPYDIFVRWKSIERQPLGWEPDLNDGVRLNIRPFMMADVLRKKPNIKWGKDRGKNPPGAPWGEERFNSYEEYFPGEKLTNAMKLAARADAARTAGASA